MVKEEDIRPQKMFQQYLDMSRKDAEAMSPSLFVAVGCPGCGDKQGVPRFEKHGFSYQLCQSCNSLFCSPRPGVKALNDFYEKSDSARFWADVFLPAVAEVRREKLFRKKAAKIRELLSVKGLSPKGICDVGAGYGIFLEELRAIFPGAEFFAIEPGSESAEKCRNKGFQTLVAPAEKSGLWKGRFDLVISSEVIEHVFSPDAFVRALSELTATGGSCLVTGLGYEGFDILNLQERSNSVYPPHHINFLSLQGFETLFKRNGFRKVEVSTPGELDLDIVHNSPLDNEFVRVLYNRGEGAVLEFQSFLRKYQLSSHVWVLAKK